MRLSVHVTFDGHCEAAFRFYESVLAGSVVTMLKYADSPLSSDTPVEYRDRIIHATLSLGAFELLGADMLPHQFERAQGFCVTLQLPDLQRTTQIFGALSTGGDVKMPLQKTFWSPGFGVVTDRFGIPWEINCEAQTS